MGNCLASALCTVTAWKIRNPLSARRKMEMTISWLQLFFFIGETCLSSSTAPPHDRRGVRRR